MGVARGVFSNEAGLGSAPIAHAAAQTKDPINQGVIAMLGTFIDTIVICSITGFVILLTGSWLGEEQGAVLTAVAFSSSLPEGDKIISFAQALFAFTTILGWSYYGERCCEYLLGTRIIVPFRIIWVASVYFGATWTLGFVWKLADTLNGMMILPNIIALLLLSPVVFKLTKKYFRKISF
jgi:AGCS family alanine or glycine:cation symporter